MFLLFSSHPTNVHWSNLEKCWTTALDSGAKVLALNILEAGYPDPTLIQTRKTLNALILNHKEKNMFVSPLQFRLLHSHLPTKPFPPNNPSTIKHTNKKFRYPMDICSAIPYFSMDEKLRKEIWLNDALHLSEKGYKVMGEKVAERLVGILKDEGP